MVVFANTGAKYPGTYEFAAESTKRLEQEFSLSVFWHEFCSIEDAVRGACRRRRSYRLVKPARLKKTLAGVCMDALTRRTADTETDKRKEDRQ